MKILQMSHGDLEQGHNRHSVVESEVSVEGGSQCLSDAEDGSCYSHFYSINGGEFDDHNFDCVSDNEVEVQVDGVVADTGRVSSVTDCSVEVEIASGVPEIKVHLGNKMERDCRICHMGLESDSNECGVPIELGCCCKGDLSAAHKFCAETWFKIKGNSPWKLPIIGNIPQLVTSTPHRKLRDLAKIYGPLMHLQLGEVFTIIVSSAEYAKEIMKTHDITFASRPITLASELLAYNSTNIVFSPYGNYWRQLRKICTLELFTPKRINSFKPIREEEFTNLMNMIASLQGSPINVTEAVLSSIYTITSRAAFGKKFKGQEQFISLAKEATVVAGGQTSATTIDWAMAEMIRDPRVMKKAQAEVRKVFHKKEMVREIYINELKYLKSVVKETLRLHPPIPLLLPRECREACEINGYYIPVKSKVIINAWAIGRDPNYWIEPGRFYPERFIDSSIDYKGSNFEYIPFGAGRRICPGSTFGLMSVEMALAFLLYHFDWKLPNGIKNEDLDITEIFGVTVRRKEDLYLIPIAFHPSLAT
ncbi:unnamed protein product [Lupinus luteus]|uniref:RING-CH-type domain-containing protein n=1 Tax=Lupinus luteus TaxID=3873 RepID=A0AAV1VZX6_LUPLU